MGILPWELGPGAGFSFVELVRNPRMTVRCEYADMPPSEVTFRLRPSAHSARRASGYH